MKTKHLIMSACLVLATGTAVFGDRESDTALSEPVKPNSIEKYGPSSAKASSNIGQKSPNLSQTISLRSSEKSTVSNGVHNAVLPLYDRQQLIARNDKNSKSILFNPHSWTPAPTPTVFSAPPPPMAPPLPFKYLGKLNESDEWQVFITRGTATFVVKKGEIIEDQYQVQEIEPPSMTLLYLPLKQTQSLTIE